MGKATNFKFGRYIYRVHPNKSPLKFWEKMERERIQGLPKFLEYPLLYQERVKLQVQLLYAHSEYRSEQKCTTNFWKSSRVRSEDSKLFRAPIYWAHRAVFFVIAQLSCYCCNNFGLAIHPPVAIIYSVYVPKIMKVCNLVDSFTVG